MTSTQLLTCALAALTTAPIAAQQRPVDAVFPDSSFAVIRMAGLERCGSTADAMKLVKLVRKTLDRSGMSLEGFGKEGEIERNLRPIARQLERLGLSARDGRALLGGDISIGIGRPTLFTAMLPSVAVAIDVRGRADSVRNVIGKIERMIAEHGTELGASWSSVRSGDDRLSQISATDVGVKVSYTFAGDFLVIGTGQGYVQDILRTIRGEQKSIRSNPAYVKAASRQPAEPMFSAFLNTRPIGRMLEPVLPYEAPAIGKALGIEQMDGLYWSSAAHAGGTMDVALAGMRGTPKGLLKALFQKRSSLAAAKVASADTMLFATASLDPGTLIATIENVMAQLPAQLRTKLERELHREVGREIRRELRQLGMGTQALSRVVELAKESFESELSVAVQLPSGREPLPAMMAFLTLRDPQKAEQLLLSHLRGHLDGDRGPKLRTRTYRGHKIHFASVRAQIQLTPSFTIVGNQLVVSPRRIDLENLIAGIERGTPRLADTAEFRKRMQAAGPASFLVHARLGEAISRGWNLVDGLIENWVEENAAMFEAEDLPKPAELREALGDLTIAAIATEDGFELRQWHPIGFGGAFAVAGSLLDWMLTKTDASLR